MQTQTTVTRKLKPKSDEVGDFESVLKHIDDNNIHTPFHIAGKLIKLRGGGHRAYWNVFGSITVQNFPDNVNHGFEGLAEIGWYKRGELSPELVQELKEKYKAI